MRAARCLIPSLRLLEVMQEQAGAKWKERRREDECHVKERTIVRSGMQMWEKWESKNVQDRNNKGNITGFASFCSCNSNKGAGTVECNAVSEKCVA